jgi:hypothetical protein
MEMTSKPNKVVQFNKYEYIVFITQYYVENKLYIELKQFVDSLNNINDSSVMNTVISYYHNILLSLHVSKQTITDNTNPALVVVSNVVKQPIKSPTVETNPIPTKEGMAG